MITYRARLEESQLVDDICDYCEENIGTITNDDGDTILKYVPYWVTEYKCVCNKCYQKLFKEDI